MIGSSPLVLATLVATAALSAHNFGAASRHKIRRLQPQQHILDRLWREMQQQTGLLILLILCVLHPGCRMHVWAAGAAGDQQQRTLCSEAGAARGRAS
jgi:hypothetical protein